MEDSELEHSQSDRIKKAMELLHVKAGVLRELFDAQESGRYIRVRNFLIEFILVKMYIIVAKQLQKVLSLELRILAISQIEYLLLISKSMCVKNFLFRKWNLEQTHNDKVEAFSKHC